jgi:hypothetical protein
MSVRRTAGVATRPNYRWLGKRGLPWDARHPLLFHVLLREGANLRELLRQDAKLLPPAMEQERSRDPAWGKRRLAGWGGIMDVDLLAGDQDLVFFVPFHPYGGGPDRAAPGVALAFDFEDIAALGEVLWRPYDLVEEFSEAEDAYFRGDEGADPEAVASSLTVTDRAIVRGLLRLQAEIIEAPERSPDVRKRARALLDPVARAQCDRPGACLKKLLLPFKAIPRDATQMLAGESEVAVRAPVPLLLARFVHEGRGLWRGLPR